MTKIDISDLLNNTELPDEKAIETSLGKFYKNYQAAKHEDLTIFAKNLRDLARTIAQSQRSVYGFDKIYKPTLCYCLAVKMGDLSACKSLQRSIKRFLYGNDIHDLRIAEIQRIVKVKAEEIKKSKPKLELESINNAGVKNLYAEFQTLEDKILEDRVDLAFRLFNEINTLISQEDYFLETDFETMAKVDKARAQALEFMEMVLDVIGEENIKKYIANRNQKELSHENVLSNLTKLPDPNKATSPLSYKWKLFSQLALAHKKGTILAVKPHKKILDAQEDTQFITALERDEHRVIINRGLFYTRNPDNTFEKFDTTDRYSHGKPGYVAYTINPQGELSTFDHFESDDGYAHSSMNAGKAVFISGEIKVEQGILKEITVYSKHYRPQQENVYELLKYLKTRNVDLAHIQLKLWHNEIPTNNDFLTVSAQEFFDNFHIKMKY